MRSEKIKGTFIKFKRQGNRASMAIQYLSSYVVRLPAVLVVTSLESIALLHEGW